MLLFVQICTVFPWGLSHHQNQEKDKDVRAICHYEHG